MVCAKGTVKDMRKNIDIIWDGIISFIPSLRRVESSTANTVPAMKDGNLVWVRSQSFSKSNLSRRKQGARRDQNVAR